MDLTDCLSDLLKPVFSANPLRDGILQSPGVIPHHQPYDPAKGFLVQPFRLRIHGNDPFEMEEMIFFILENFKIGVNHLLFKRESPDWKAPLR